MTPTETFDLTEQSIDLAEQSHSVFDSIMDSFSRRRLKVWL